MSVILGNSKVAISPANKIVTRGGGIGSLPNLKRWWAARFEPVVADGTAQTNLKDASGNGYGGIQSTGANKALYKVNIQNGLPSLLFDGTNDTYAITPLTLVKNCTGITYYGVYKKTSVANNQYLFHVIATGPVTRYSVVCNVNGTGEIISVATRVDGSGVSSVPRAGNNDTSVHVMCISIDFPTGRHSIYLDGALISTEINANTGSICSNTDALNIQIGANISNPAVPSNFFTGHLFEDVVCDTNHTESVKMQTMAYLKQVYAI